ncbi:hypothetical protein PENFLA_c082G01708 [Penicillium flavigenum]|uniref:Uncharacterized protein n=1 Tax=Penicillium flavigenum TaxID=254877 RepID=A0A1V6S9W2_9EURO|nr:hypothetical protein PENFLA_c082G01708 [Penicillium flavigenum]
MSGYRRSPGFRKLVEAEEPPNEATSPHQSQGSNKQAQQSRIHTKSTPYNTPLFKMGPGCHYNYKRCEQPCPPNNNNGGNSAGNNNNIGSGNTTGNNSGNQNFGQNTGNQTSSNNSAGDGYRHAC